ncbi:MAG: CHAT domain-containing protein [Blastocatellia bacterium]
MAQQRRVEGKRGRRAGPVKILCRLLALVMAALLFPGAARAVRNRQGDEPRPLAAGSPVERRLSGGQLHAYRVALSEGQYLRLIVEQRGIDVTLAFIGIDGNPIFEIDSPNGTEGTEEIPYVIRVAGDYRVTVRSTDKDAPAGAYEIRIAELRTAGGHDEDRAAGERNMAEADRLLRGKDAKLHRQAIGSFEAAAAAWRAAGETAKEAEALYGLSSVHYELGDMARASDGLSQSLLLYRKAGDRAGEARALSGIGAVLGGRGEARRALETFTQMLWVMREIGDLDGQLAAFSNIGAMHATLGEMQEAFDAYDAALRLARSVNVNSLRPEARRVLRSTEGALWTNICNGRIRLGEWQPALDACRSAVATFHELRELRAEGLAVNRIALALISLGDLQQAMERDQEALRLLRQVGDRRNEAIVLNDIGLIHYYQGEFAQAAEMYRQSLALAGETGNRGGQAVTLKNLGTVYGLLGSPAQALEPLTQSLSITREIGDRQGELAALQSLGSLASLSGDYAKAIEHHRQSLEISRAIRLAPREAAALHSLARAERELGRLEEARTLGEESLRITERLRANVAGPEMRSAFFSTVQDRYDSQIETLMRLHARAPDAGHARAAWQTSERARARSLLEMLAEPRADIRQGVDPALLARDHAIQRQLNAKAALQSRMLGGRHTDAQAAEVAREIADLTARLREVETEIRRASPAYADLTQPQSLTVEELQRQVLDPETMLLEYALGEKESYLWAVTTTGFSSYRLPPRAEIEAAARKVQERMSVRPERAAADPAWIAMTESLSRMLLGPATAQLAGKRLVIVAPGVLSYLPFAMLPDPSPRKPAAAASSRAVPLIAGREIIHLPSASVLSVIRRETAGRKPPARAVAILADPVFAANDPRIAPAGDLAKAATPAASPLDRLPRAPALRNGLARLPFSRQEADAIFAVAPTETSLKATDFNASRETAMSPRLGDYRIVHFATHGLLDNRQPELSGLAFSLVDRNGNEQDGFLRLHEVYNLRLNADLVVLSACETALGREVRGEGLIGLTRGFMYAGAPRVVASLWNVDDLATAELMKRFYQFMLRDGLRPAAALAAAQVEISQQRRWAAPYFWAGFMLQGDWR